MKLADSLNPATQAENIKKLNAGLEAVYTKTLPSTSTATTGQILKLTGETKTPVWADEYSYTPPAYSETEVNTGQKWIDGKYIYVKVLTGTTTDTTTGLETIGSISFDNIVSFMFYYNSGADIRYTNIMYVKSNGDLVITKAATVAEKKYSAYVYYTKPDPTPGRAPEDENERVEKLYSYDENENPEDFVTAEVIEPEPEEKKTTKKKTTK